MTEEKARRPRSEAQQAASRRFYEQYRPWYSLNPDPGHVDAALVGSVWYDERWQIALSYERTRPDEEGEEWIVGRTFWRGERCRLQYEEPVAFPAKTLRRVR